MTKERELLERALELMDHRPLCKSLVSHHYDCNCGFDALYGEIEVELAKPEVEPYGIEWPEFYEDGMGCGLEDRGINDRYEAMRYGWDCAIEAIMLPEKLYTSPPQQKPLSDEEIKQVMDWVVILNSDREFVRAIEKSHGIG